MKLRRALLVLSPLALPLVVAESPVKRVVNLIKELQTEVQADKKAEEEQFAKFKTWCDETIADTTKDITKAKTTIKEQDDIIEGKSGAGGAATAQIAHLEKSLVENEASTKDATSIREKEAATFKKAKEDYDAGIATMKEMMEKLTPKTEEKKSLFLQVNSALLQQRRSIIQQLLRMTELTAKLSSDQMDELQDFAHPDTELMQLSGESEGAPSSALEGVISVVRETKEDYEADAKESETDEAKKKEAYEKLMKTLADEKTSMTEELTAQKAAKAAAEKEVAQAKTLREETEAELKAEKKLLDETEMSCKKKTLQFNDRQKLRTEELEGVDQAIKILESDEAKKTFEESGKVSFLQLATEYDGVRQKAYDAIRNVASKYHCLAMAQIAMQVQSVEGHAFDKVIYMIEKQVKALIEEQKEDIEHKDKCDKQMAENKKLIAELTDKIEKFKKKSERIAGQKDKMEKELAETEKSIADTKKEMDELQKLRQEENAKYLEAVQHDKDALEIVEQATVVISKFFKAHGGKALLETTKAEVKLHGDPKPKPEIFDDKAYNGAQGATNGVIRMMKMVAQDLEEEIETGRKNEQKNQDQFNEDLMGMKDALDTQLNKKKTQMKEIAEMNEFILNKDQIKQSTEADKETAEAEKKTLDENCAWVKDKFLSRYNKRQAEMDGLEQAKGLLAGAMSS